MDKNNTTLDVRNIASSLTLSKKDFINEYEYPELKRKYKILSVLDEGGFGRIYNAIDRVYQAPCAIKKIKIPSQNNQQTQFIAEFELLKSLDHPNIVWLIEAFRGEENLYLVTELCKGHNLIKDMNEREKLTESQVAQIVWQILKAVNYCHK